MAIWKEHHGSPVHNAGMRHARSSDYAHVDDRAIDQFGQVIDVLITEKRDLAATCRFFTPALRPGSRPAEVSTDRAPAYPRALDDLLGT
jgi:transposase-like protein